MGTKNNLDNTRTGISARMPQQTEAQQWNLSPTSCPLPVSCDSSKIGEMGEIQALCRGWKVPVSLLFAAEWSAIQPSSPPYAGITSGGDILQSLPSTSGTAMLTWGREYHKGKQRLEGWGGRITGVMKAERRTFFIIERLTRGASFWK
jgi:hypothetical protein